MSRKTNLIEENQLGEVLVPSTAEIPEITDDGYVFDRIKRKTATIPVKQPISRSSEQESSNTEITGPRPEGRPLSPEEAAAVQRRIRTLTDKAALIDALSANVTSNLKNQLEDFDYQVDISNNPIASKAVRKVFARGIKYIDKQMYLEAVERLNEIQQKKLKKEVDI
jgi:hypothetical protein